MSEGHYTLYSDLDLTKFDAQFGRFETNLRKRLTGLEQNFSKVFTGGNAGQLAAQVKPLTDALLAAAAAGVKLGDGVSGGAAKVKREVDPTKEAIRGLSNELNNYKVRLEAGELEQAEFVRGMQGVIARSKELRGTVADNSTEFGRLTNIVGTATRSITTAEGRVSALGLSQQVALGHTSRLTDSVRGLGTGVVSLGGALPGVIGAAGLGGLVTVTADLAKQADTTRVAQEVLSATIERTGQDAGAVQEAISDTADALKLTDAQVADSAATLLRLGLNAEQIEEGLTSAGASALAFGTTSAQGVESFTSALATGNSAALNTIGIAENIGKAMNEASAAHAGQGEQAAKAASATAGLNIVLKATESEVELLDTLTGGLAGKQADAARAAFEARQAFGEMLIPLETLRNEALAGVLGQFTEMPQATQASIVGIGGVTGGVTVLTAGMVGLRAAMLPLFAPPAGLIIAGVAAAAALGTGLYNLANASIEARDGTAALRETQAALDQNGYLEHLTTTKEAVTQLTAATNKDGLTKALTTYADTLDTAGKTALQSFIATTLTATLGQGEYQKAVDLSIAKVLEFQVAATRAETEQNYSLINQNQVALDSLQGQIARAEAALDNYQNGAGSALRKALPGYESRMQVYVEGIAGLKSNYDQLSESSELLRRENEQVNVSYVRLLEIQADYQNGTLTAEEAATQLIGSLGEGAAAAQAFASGLSESEGAGNGLSETADTAEDTGTALRSAADDAIAYADAILGVNAVGLNPNFRQGLTDEAAALRDAERAQLEYQDSLKTAGGLSQNAAAAATASGQALLRQATEMRAVKTEANAYAESQSRVDRLQRDMAANADEGAKAYTRLTLGTKEAGGAAEDFSDFLTTANSQAYAAETGLRNLGTSTESLSDFLSGANAEAADYNTLVRESANGSQDFATVLSNLQAKGHEANTALANTKAQLSGLLALTPEQVAFNAAVGDLSGRLTENASRGGVLNAVMAEYTDVVTSGGDGADVLMASLQGLIQKYPELEKDIRAVIAALKDQDGAAAQAANGGTKTLFGVLTDGEKILFDTLDMVLGKLGDLAGGFEGAGESTGQFLSNFADGLSALLRLDFVGFVSSAVNAVVDLFQHGARESGQYAAAVEESGEAVAKSFQKRDWMGREYFDEEAYDRYKAEMGEYAGAVETHGTAIADKFLEINEAGERVFNEEAFNGYVQGLERLEVAAEELNDTLAEIDSGYADVQGAEVEARQSALDAKLDSQGGEYTFADVLEEQTLAIGEAAQRRDEAYERAAELDAAGQDQLADRLRASADSTYNSNVSSINQNAANQANAIGEASDTYWTEARCLQACSTTTTVTPCIYLSPSVPYSTYLSAY